MESEVSSVDANGNSWTLPHTWQNKNQGHQQFYKDKGRSQDVTKTHLAKDSSLQDGEALPAWTCCPSSHRRGTAFARSRSPGQSERKRCEAQMNVSPGDLEVGLGKPNGVKCWPWSKLLSFGNTCLHGSTHARRRRLEAGQQGTA